jgi:ATP-binding cassette subfamily B protein
VFVSQARKQNYGMFIHVYSNRTETTEMEFVKEPSRSNDRVWTNIAWAVRFIWESGPGLTSAIVLLTVIQSIVPLLGLYLTKLILDAITRGVTSSARTAAFREVAFLIILSAGIFVLDKIVGNVAELARNAQTLIVTDRVYEVLHAKSIEVDLEYYDNSEYYDALHRAQSDASYRPTRVLDGVFGFLQSAISVIGLGGLLLIIHWSVPVVLVVAAIPDLLLRLRFAKTSYRQSRWESPTERQALYFTSLLTGDAHAKEIRIFGLGPVFLKRFGRLREQIREQRLKLYKKRSVSTVFAQSAGILPGFALFAFFAYRVLQGFMTVGDLVMFSQAVQRGQSYLGQLFGSIATLYENNLFLSNVLEFLALKPKVIDSPRPKKAAGNNREGIVFHDVRFGYPNSERTVLDGISFRIPRGQHIALVGENGSGKTTLVKLLLRLYDPTDGVITLDGVDLRDLSLQSLRRNISVVFQDYSKYNLSVKENIWLGDVDLPADEQRIINAAKKSGAHQTIAGLPAGYDTLLGKWFEAGEELSIGEWQKIALARAFLREANLIILDEPTSALDAKAEYEVFNKFHQLSSDRTAILISHRLSTVKMADHIYFLENGKIVESGSHDELIGHNGKYAYMFERQAQNYR